MKKISVAIIGGMLFIAGYYQVRRQTEFTTTKAILVTPAPAINLMAVPLKTAPAFAFRLDMPFMGTK